MTGALASVFVDANAGNYLLRTNSPALDIAQPSGVTNDFDGNSRPSGSAPDIGCYEASPLRLQMLSQTNGFRLKVSGGAGRSYRVETAAGMTNWSLIASFVRSNRSIEMTVTSGNGPRFYRASWSP